jgi:hypothetical protein
MGRTPKDSIPPDLRWQIFERDDYVCHYCGRRAPLSVDHIVPESKGGKLELDNLISACGSCNSRKGTMSYEDFLFHIETEFAFGYIIRTKRSFSITDEFMIELYQHTSIGVHLRLAENDGFCILIPGNPNGSRKNRWFFLPGKAAPEIYSEAIRSLRSLKLYAKAERLVATARERFPASYVLIDPVPVRKSR